MNQEELKLACSYFQMSLKHRHLTRDEEKNYTHVRHLLGEYDEPAVRMSLDELASRAAITLEDFK